MIKLIILGQTLSIVTSKVVAGTHRYLEVEGDFKGDDWEGFRKWIHFQDPGRTVHYVLPMYNDRISAEQMLDLTGGTWDVRVHGNYETDDEDLVRIETEVRQLFVEGDETGSPFPPLTPEFEEILANRVEDAVGIAQSVRDDADAGEFDGATFTPDVDDDGIISWTNDQGKENPEPKNIKGPKGDTGESGVYIGTAEPTDPAKDVWINPEGGIGRVITSIDTSGTHQPGTYDTYTLHFNEGEDLVLRVYNGVDGEGTGDMLKAAYDPQNKATDIFDYADEAAETAAASAAAGKANTADLASVAFSGSYNDLSNKPTIPTVDSAMSSSSENPVQNKVINAALNQKANASDLAAVATSGSYNDLRNKPTIPAAVTVDSSLSSVSTNPVQNKVIKQALDQKQNTLTIDSAISGSSTNPVQNRAIKQAIDSLSNGGVKNPNSLSIVVNGVTTSYDGSQAKSVSISTTSGGSEIVVENIQLTTPQLSPGTANNVVVDISKAGYTPLGIVGAKVLYPASGPDIIDFHATSSGLAEVWFRNNFDSTTTSGQSAFIHVLYKRN